MADETTEVVDDVQAEKDFAEGFTASKVTATPPKTDDTPAILDTAPVPAVTEDPPAVVATDPPPTPAPEYVQITKAQFDAFEAAAAKTVDFDKKFDKAFGSLGGLQDTIKQLQASTPKGEPVVLTDEIFAAMAEDYPELAKHQRTILEKVLKGAVGTGSSTATVDPAEIDKRVAEGIKQREMEALEDDYPDWRGIVGAVDSPDKADPNNPFRKWLTTQPADYAKKVLSSHSASVLAKAISKFKDATKTPPPKTPVVPAVNPKDAARRAVIKGAVPPKGEGTPPPAKKTADDEFQAGFASG